MTQTPIGITGATGKVGRLLVAELDNAEVPMRLIVRDPARIPGDFGEHASAQASYGDAAALRRAFEGLETVFMVSAAESANRVAEHFSVIDAARSAGVHRVVYLSFVGADEGAAFTLARDHAKTEQYLRDSGLQFTILRDNLYQHAFAAFTGTDGVIRGPADDGRVGAIAHRDVAASAAAVLTAGGRFDSETFTLTGPRTYSLSEAAEQLGRVAGRTISYHAETEDYESREHFGAPRWEVTGWISSYLAIAAGEMDVVTDDVLRLTGRQPIDFAQYLAENPRDYKRLG
ncbi:SDR family oxidoreductase [Saxibacter everestensis]|uniref:SDR family oxidoreductase n=1 Tax=Saxibacter everestensis TaxID=2909229 RepID=A0ABY8QQQ7_9MICO|nr:SDR family oxidoreductase [Brevibacteriaceae bacterium ZFBP1038]